MRIAAIVEYCGASFYGWQYQEGSRTVQGEVERAVSFVANETVRVITAGRTDTGVHASAQVIHFDTRAERSQYSWFRGVNAQLPDDIKLRWIDVVDDEFHARFSATGRWYRYVILNRQSAPALLYRRVTHEYRDLDATLMQHGASFLLGRHDFSSYRTVHCQAKSPVREIRKLDVIRQGEFIHIIVYADAFLHHMVRNIAGVLMAIGTGEQPPEWAREVLEMRDRTRGGVTAPADGLYLTRIEYPEHFNIPQLPPGTGLW
ncbi:MAG: tRNA pseudouridine(38-40) synthase TruA [Gammaproteobacteria bacterium]|nr:tRNA pseudouridine(38-40) synthase TruA [Gammaproteobacteria bacterium]